MREKVKRTIILTVTLIFVYVDSVYAYPAQCSISVTRREQQQSNWCWAATAQMIGDHYRPLKTQNNIVTMKLLQEILFLLVMFNLILLEEDYSE
ncbi:hypothetical protein [Agathobacter sp.]